MSGTGQYLRHPWTHRSEFQKTKGYGKINLEDCTVTGAKTLVLDSDDELSDSGRAVKRRRIEKLAEGYLRGQRLFISSARPCPQALQRTVVWHKKSSTEPGFVLPEVDTSRESSQTWKDVEDDDEILARLLRPSTTRQQWDESLATRSEPIEAEPVEDLKAQASCKPQRRLRPANLGSGPSEEALRQAAALRNRKGRAALEVTTVAEVATDLTTPASDSSDCINVTQSGRVLRSRYDKRDWLSRRRSRFSFGGENAQGGEEAASSPCIAPSSPPPHSPQRQTVSSPTKRHGRDDLSGGSDLGHSQQRASYHTAPEDKDVFEEPVEASLLGDLTSQPQLSRTSTNFATPGHALGGTAASGSRTQRDRKHATFQDEIEREHVDASHDPPIVTTIQKASSKKPTPNVGTQSAPATRSRGVAEQAKPTYLQAPSTQNGTTPLMYRKRSTRSKATNQQPEAISARLTRRSTRRRVTFPSSEDVQTGGPPHGDEQHIASHPPMLDMSFQPDYSFAPKLNMALVEEHQNTLLPVDPASVGRTSSVKKALRRELRDSGAEITICGSEPPPSSQIQDVTQPAPQDSASSESLARTSEQNTSKASNSERRQTWLGTQAMVARAERELFTSPGKRRGTFTPINEQTPVFRLERASTYTPLSQERELLKQLSQEPAPSTQAMLETFGGFSTVKKPRSASAFKHAAEPTPVAVEKGKRRESRVLSEARRSSLGTSSTSDKAKENRGSSLRFSISSFDSPAATDHQHEGPQETAEVAFVPAGSTTTSLATPAPSSSSRSGRKSALKRSHPKPSQAQHSPRRSTSQAGGIFSQSQSMFVSGDLSTLNFQAAQAPEAPSVLLRDPSNMSQTIDDLTRDVLETSRYLEGVWSQ